MLNIGHLQFMGLGGTCIDMNCPFRHCGHQVGMSSFAHCALPPCICHRYIRRRRYRTAEHNASCCQSTALVKCKVWSAREFSSSIAHRDVSPWSITPDLDPDIATMFGGGQTKKNEPKKRSQQYLGLVLLALFWLVLESLFWGIL